MMYDFSKRLVWDIPPIKLSNGGFRFHKVNSSCPYWCRVLVEEIIKDNKQVCNSKNIY